MDADPRSGALARWGRALLLASLVLSVTLVAHGAGGGAVPPVGALLVAVLALLVPLAALLGGPARPARLAALLAGGQAVMHGVLSATGGPAAGAHGHGHGHGSAHVEAAAPALLAPDARMLLAHVVASAVLLVLLARGEGLLWRVVGLLAAATDRVLVRLRATLALLARAAGPAPARPAAPGPRVLPLRSQCFPTGSAALRAPPAAYAS